jgi:hypothetical protein
MRLRLCAARAVTAFTIGLAALAAGAAAADAQTWTAAATLATCGAATAPKVVFPYKLPTRRVRDGAIVWLGLSPSCTDIGTGQTSVDIAAIASDDQPGPPLAFSGGAAAGVGLVGPLVTASTARGKVVVIAGSSAVAALGGPEAVFGAGYATGAFDSLTATGGPADLVATADGYIGDADIASVLKTSSGEHVIALRAERHHAYAFAAPYILPAGRAPVTALALGMDYRADTIVVWAQGGDVWARWVSQDGVPAPRQRLGTSGYAPQISAVLSDDNRAFVVWTDEPPLGTSGLTRVYLAHSAAGPIFHGASVLTSFTEPADVRLTPGSVALERLSGEGVALAWPAMVGGYYVVDASGVSPQQLASPSVLSEPSADLRLGAIATGPTNDLVVLAEVAPRLASGWNAAQQQILATRSNEASSPGLGFGPLVPLTTAGTNSVPSVAVDPDTDTAVAAWQSALFGVPSVQWSVGAPAS